VNTAAPASLPPAGLPGLDPAWSRLVQAKDGNGTPRTWHVLDTGPEEPVGTLLCVHGNPTWSYTFRCVLAAAGDRWRVVAPDHLGMGYSERTGERHLLADRVAELDALTEALEVSGPVVTVAHDWGGSISLGWAEQHKDMLAGIVLLNTAVSQPEDSPVPKLIQWARRPSLLRTSTQRTQAFLRGTLRLAHPPLSSEVAAAYRAPYRGADRRGAIADFVADIPLERDHPTHDTLQAIATGLGDLQDVPTLLLWGPRDPVFTERYLRDLQQRLPQATTHRYEGCGHLVVEDAPVAAAVRQFADDVASDRHVSTAAATASPAAPLTGMRAPLWSRIEERADDVTPAVVEMGRRGASRTVSWQRLNEAVRDVSAGLTAVGVAPGDRVALLVPPGADLSAVLYACWRSGATPVVADAGLGLPGLRRALRGANVQHVIGIAKGLAAAKAIGLRGTVVSVGAVAPGMGRALGVDYSLVELRQIGRGRPLAPVPSPNSVAAVLFTSGATGPAKGVVYRHRQLEAQRDLVRRAFDVEPDDRLVAAFAPFALFGPALGITSVVPHMDVTEPGTLTARALADAVSAVDATLVFAAPAALRNVVRTSPALRTRERQSLQSVRLLLSAGAPVASALLRRAVEVFGGCDAHTPYGMTEALPVCDVTLDETEAAGRGDGVLVGQPLPGVQVAVSPLSSNGESVGALTDEPGITGEVCVRAPHVKDHYDQLWLTQRESARDSGWHRTGDVGHLDANGALWIEGRLAHVITASQGVVTPVGIELAVEELEAVSLAAAVGVGPAGTQVVVVVLQAPRVRPGLAPLELVDDVRAVARTGVAAVLVVRELPVDIRHNSKIDRRRVAEWAARVLAGDGSARL
jgi:acyl-coenzyme A synthetase/AMP-(fatty) acid ligase/pimeloyl-ACP methyl ester carboxylesterase